MFSVALFDENLTIKQHSIFVSLSSSVGTCKLLISSKTENAFIILQKNTKKYE